MGRKTAIVEEMPTASASQTELATNAIKGIHDLLKDIPADKQVRILKAVAILLDIDLYPNIHNSY